VRLPSKSVRARPKRLLQLPSALFVRLRASINQQPDCRQFVSTPRFVPRHHAHDTHLAYNHVSRRRHHALRHGLRSRHTRSRPCLRVRTVCLPTPRTCPIAFASPCFMVAFAPTPPAHPRRTAVTTLARATPLPPFLQHPCARQRPASPSIAIAARYPEQPSLTTLKLRPPCPLRHSRPPFGLV
jgi:hypothetical protein